MCGVTSFLRMTGTEAGGDLGAPSCLSPVTVQLDLVMSRLILKFECQGTMESNSYRNTNMIAQAHVKTCKHTIALTHTHAHSLTQAHSITFLKALA